MRRGSYCDFMNLWFAFDRHGGLVNVGGTIQSNMLLIPWSDPAGVGG